MRCRKTEIHKIQNMYSQLHSSLPYKEYQTHPLYLQNFSLGSYLGSNRILTSSFPPFKYSTVGDLRFDTPLIEYMEMTTRLVRCDRARLAESGLDADGLQLIDEP